ncbi:FMN-binding negative transcriptional regulator [Planctomonas deserti]|uniref:FMN-binding negative transcriptional regulator n=1 Tax=Planctomonas deserti TaxID=2144185 RepID=UPI000D3B226B|nr:FMN-binding negative transcriptional regulator [Planctomonas deserti]
MRSNPSFAMEDPDEVKRWIRENPWVVLVSHTADGLVASHYPVILDEEHEGISVLSHVGRPDEGLHELGRHEVLLIVQGPHGYVSPGWYGEGPAVPTWNFLAAHLYGVPEILTDEENYRVLGLLVDRFEDRMPNPRRLADSAEYAKRIVKGTVGFRLTATRFTAKAKLSQNKTAEVVHTVIDRLEHGEEYANPELAREMRLAHGLDR